MSSFNSSGLEQQVPLDHRLGEIATVDRERLSILLAPLIETVRDDQAALSALPRVAKRGLVSYAVGPGVESRIAGLDIFRPARMRPQRITSEMRLPSAEYVATSMSPVGGVFHDGARFGASAVASKRSLILISE
jgi:hypothetical protein